MAVITHTRALAGNAHTQTWIGKMSTARLLPLLLCTAAILLTVISPSSWLTNLLISPAAASVQTSTYWPSFRHGVMYTRNFVRGENGERIFAEFGMALKVCPQPPPGACRWLRVLSDPPPRPGSQLKVAPATQKACGLLRASCPTPFGPASGCSKSLPAI